MSTFINSSNLFGPSAYVVSRNLGPASYTSIQAAINAASAAGGGTVLVQHGTYTENLTLNQNVPLIGVTVDGRALVAPTIIGSHTYAGGILGNLTLIRNLKFTSSTSPIFTVSSGTLVLETCAVSNSSENAVLVSGGGVVIFNSSLVNGDASNATLSCASGTAATLNNSQISNANSAGLSISFSGSTLQMTNGNSLTGTLSVLAGQANSANTTFNSSNALSCVTLAAATTLVSSEDIFTSNVGSGYFVSGTGEFNYSAANITGTALEIDPGVTTVPFLTRPVATAAANLSASVRGTASFNSSNFSVADGFVSLAGVGVTWINLSTDITTSSNTSYFIQGSILIFLPAAPHRGDTIAFVNQAGLPFVVDAGGGQKIAIGSSTSSLSGNAQSSLGGDSLTLVYEDTNTTWYATSVIGNWTLA